MPPHKLRTCVDEQGRYYLVMETICPDGRLDYEIIKESSGAVKYIYNDIMRDVPAKQMKPKPKDLYSKFRK